jgi:hypothetical protein
MEQQTHEIPGMSLMGAVIAALSLVGGVSTIAVVIAIVAVLTH